LIILEITLIISNLILHTYNEHLAPLSIQIYGYMGVIASLLIIYGFLKGTKWSWWIALIVYTTAIINYILIATTRLKYAEFGLVIATYGINTLNVSIFCGAILQVIYILYLTRPHVKKWFGFN
jgi:hypothetical protein